MYAPVLRQYGLKPFRMEQHGKVKKVYTNAGTFALKEIANVREMEAVWQSYIFCGQQSVPLYLTKQGLPFAAHGRHYYLMPWVFPAERKDTREHVLSFFRDLAHLHQKSLRQLDVSEEEINNYYENKKESGKGSAPFCNHMWKSVKMRGICPRFNCNAAPIFMKQCRRTPLRKRKWRNGMKPSKRQKNGESPGFTGKRGFHIISFRKTTAVIFSAGNAPAGILRYLMLSWRFAIICAHFRRSAMNGWKGSKHTKKRYLCRKRNNLFFQPPRPTAFFVPLHL